jgi:hypothetical protein
LALICGGTRSWLDEEIYKARPHELSRALKQIERVYAKPQSTKLTWFGYSFATWTSYDTDATAKALEQLTIPILGLFSSHDRLIDVESARGDLERQREMGKPVRTRVFEGVDHTLEHKWPAAWRAVGAFYRSSETMASATRMPSQAALVIPPA